MGVDYLEIPLPPLAGGFRGVKAEDPDGGSQLFGDSSPPTCGGIQGGMKQVHLAGFLKLNSPSMTKGFTHAHPHLGMGNLYRVNESLNKITMSLEASG